SYPIPLMKSERVILLNGKQLYKLDRARGTTGLVIEHDLSRRWRVSLHDPANGNEKDSECLHHLRASTHGDSSIWGCLQDGAAFSARQVFYDYGAVSFVSGTTLRPPRNRRARAASANTCSSMV